MITANPLPIPESIGSHYDMPAEAYWTDSSFYRVSDKYFDRELRILRSLLGISSFEGHKALDIGTGIGKLFYVLNRAGFDTWGIEPSTTFRRKGIELGYISPEKVILSSVEEAIFPDESFDFITFSAVFEHLYFPSIVLEKVLRWLKPGGVIHIEVPSANWLISVLLNLFYRLRGTDYTTHLSPMHPPYHIHEFTPKAFELNSRKLGYKVVLIEHLPGYLHSLRLPILLLRPIMKVMKADMQLVVWIRKI